MTHEQSKTRTAECQQTIDRLRAEMRDAEASLQNCIFFAFRIDPNSKQNSPDAALAWARVDSARAMYAAAHTALLEAEK